MWNLEQEDCLEIARLIDGDFNWFWNDHFESSGSEDEYYALNGTKHLHINSLNDMGMSEMGDQIWMIKIFFTTNKISLMKTRFGEDDISEEEYDYEKNEKVLRILKNSIWSIKTLLDKIIDLHFPTHIFSLKGKLEWIPVNEKQKERHFEKFGKQLKNQRRRYRIKEIYWEGETKEGNGPFGSSHHHIVISDIEKDGIFYIMNDNKEGRMGQTFRYKFQIIDYDLTKGDPSDHNIELLETKMTMIR